MTPVADVRDDPPLPQIDVHAHLFNGDDLPVRGFITNAARPFRGHERLNALAGRVLGWYAASSPPLSVDETMLRGWISGPSASEPATGAAWRRRLRGGSPAERRSAVRLLDPRRVLGVVLWPLREARMLREPHRSRLTMLCRLDRWSRRAVRHDGEGGRPSIDDHIDLYVPLAVDMECGARQPAAITPVAQFDFLALLSEASLRGCLREHLKIDALVLPMIGYEPRRLDFGPTRDRIEAGTAIGLKLYPPMGFHPWRNGNCAQLDEHLAEIYGWCAKHQVPITAHCSPANAVKDFECAADAPNWGVVLDEFGDLRLNLAHAGGLKAKGWNARALAFIAERRARGQTVYLDVSNHDLSRKAELENFFRTILTQIDDLARPLAGVEPADLFEQVMFGSDYWFLCEFARPSSFLENYVTAARRAICCHYREPQEADRLIASFLGGAASRFLGLRDASNQNHQRVIRRLRGLASDAGPFDPPPSVRKVLGSASWPAPVS